MNSGALGVVVKSGSELVPFGLLKICRFACLLQLINLEGEVIMEFKTLFAEKSTFPIWNEHTVFYIDKSKEISGLKVTVLAKSLLMSDVAGTFIIYQRQLSSRVEVENWFEIYGKFSGKILLSYTFIPIDSYGYVLNNSISKIPRELKESLKKNCNIVERNGEYSQIKFMYPCYIVKSDETDFGYFAILSFDQFAFVSQEELIVQFCFEAKDISALLAPSASGIISIGTLQKEEIILDGILHRQILLDKITEICKISVVRESTGVKYVAPQCYGEGIPIRKLLKRSYQAIKQRRRPFLGHQRCSLNSLINKENASIETSHRKSMLALLSSDIQSNGKVPGDNVEIVHTTQDQTQCKLETGAQLGDSDEQQRKFNSLAEIQPHRSERRDTLILQDILQDISSYLEHQALVELDKLKQEEPELTEQETLQGNYNDINKSSANETQLPVNATEDKSCDEERKDHLIVNETEKIEEPEEHVEEDSSTCNNNLGSRGSRVILPVLREKQVVYGNRTVSQEIRNREILILRRQIMELEKLNLSAATRAPEEHSVTQTTCSTESQISKIFSIQKGAISYGLTLIISAVFVICLLVIFMYNLLYMY